MRLIVNTTRGAFQSSERPCSEEDRVTLMEMLKNAADGQAQYLKIDRDDGCFIVGRELLKTAVFEVIE